MSANPLSVLFPAVRGMDMRIGDATFTGQQAGRFVQWARNMRIHRGYWRTRFPFREIPLTKPEGFDARYWQGGMIYQPHAGQGAHYLGVGKDRIVASYGGRLFEVDLESKEVRAIAQDRDAGANLLPVHLTQAENYVIRTDGVSQTLIHDGSGTTFFSRGYNKANPEASSVPNFAGPVRYIRNRLWVSTFGRRLYAGDVLHQLDPEDAIDVIRFRDQSYDATGQWFAPESFQGDTVALTMMKVGENEFVVMHGDNMGMTGIRLNVPREEWGNQPMKLVISNETAAAGPYAYAEGDWRLLFRSRRGIEETRLLLAEDNTIGGTNIDIGKQVARILEADMEELLIFSTLVNPPRWDRTFVTASPRIDCGIPTHEGILSLNRNPADSIEPGQWAWEGAWSLPPRMGKIQQMLQGRIDARQRVFALTRTGSGNGLVEFGDTDGLDTLGDGTKVRQNGAIRTHRLSTASEYVGNDFGNACFLIRDIASDIDAQLWVRDSEQPDWQLQRSLTVKREGLMEDREAILPIGKLTKVHRNARWVQFHLETWGVASWDFTMEPGASDSLAENSRTERTVRADCDSANFGVFDYQER